MTQRELADQLGVTQQSVARWEQGSPPRRYMLRIIESLLEEDDGGDQRTDLADSSAFVKQLRGVSSPVTSRALGMVTSRDA